jgi:hypothetical protein
MGGYMGFAGRVAVLRRSLLVEYVLRLLYTSQQEDQFSDNNSRKVGFSMDPRDDSKRDPRLRQFAVRPI